MKKIRKNEKEEQKKAQRDQIKLRIEIDETIERIRIEHEQKNKQVIRDGKMTKVKPHFGPIIETGYNGTAICSEEWLEAYETHITENLKGTTFAYKIKNVAGPPNEQVIPNRVINKEALIPIWAGKKKRSLFKLR